MTATSNTNPLLAGRTVVIVDPEKQREAFLKGLESYGARIITCPAVEIGEPASYEPLDEALDHLYGYDWLLFTSVPGVESCLRRLRDKGLDSSALDELRVCTIGDATERLLQEEHVHVDVAAAKPDTKTVFAALESFIGDRRGLSELNFLSPRAAVVRDSLARALGDAGARVDLVPAYRTQSSPEIDLGRTAAMFSAAADYILLTSPAATVQLARLFDVYDLGEVLAEVFVGCFDQASANAAVEYGLNVKVLPEPVEVALFAEAIATELHADVGASRRGRP